MILYMLQYILPTRKIKLYHLSLLSDMPSSYFYFPLFLFHFGYSLFLFVFIFIQFTQRRNNTYTSETNFSVAKCIF